MNMSQICTPVLADYVMPRSRSWQIVASLTLIAVGAIAIALSAQVAVMLPFTPVPITLQTFTVLLAGILLGSRRGASAAAVYVTAGALGLPLFAAGAGGAARLAGPTGGYLIGFIAAAFVTGLLAEHGFDRRLLTMVIAMCVGNIVIYAFGLPWLACYVGAGKALALGLVPFIAGDLLKMFAAGILLPAVHSKLIPKSKSS